MILALCAKSTVDMLDVYFLRCLSLFLWRRLIILYDCRAHTEHCHSIIALLSTRFFGFPRWLCYLDSLDFIRSMDHRFRRSLSLIFSDLSKRLAVLSETVRLVLASLGYLLFGFGATLLNTAPWLVRSARRQWVSFWRDGWNFNEWNLEKCVKQGWGRRAQVCQGRFESWIISHQKQAAQVGLLAAVRVAPSQHSGKAAACVLCSNLSCSLHICCCNYLVIVRVQKISIICRVFICLYVYSYMVVNIYHHSIVLAEHIMISPNLVIICITNNSRMSCDAPSVFLSSIIGCHPWFVLFVIIQTIQAPIYCG